MLHILFGYGKIYTKKINVQSNLFSSDKYRRKIHIKTTGPQTCHTHLRYSTNDKSVDLYFSISLCKLLQPKELKVQNSVEHGYNAIIHFCEY